LPTLSRIVKGTLPGCLIVSSRVTGTSMEFTIAQWRCTDALWRFVFRLKTVHQTLST
jgi:hypothetical protein